MDLDIASIASNIIVDWTQITEPDINEVWRSIDGGSYALLASVAGNVGTYTDTNLMALGETRCFKVRGVTGSSESDFSNEWCAVRNMLFASSGAVSQPTWRLAFGNLEPDDAPSMTSLAMAGLKLVSSTLQLDGTLAMTSLNMNGLVEVGADLFLDQTALTTLSLPSLTTVGEDLHADQCSVLGSVNLPLLVSVGADIRFPDCPFLTTVNMPNFVFTNANTVRFDNCALTAASVNHLLARMAASGVTSATLDTSGGTSAAPTGQGIVDKANLITAGNSVTTN